MKNEIKNLIEKYELKRKVVTEQLQKSEKREDILVESAVRRFISEFISDLKEFESSPASGQSELQRPKIKDYFPESSLTVMHDLYLDDNSLWNYIQDLDKYCDELEKSASPKTNVGVHDVEKFYKDVCECKAPTYRDKYGDHRCTQCEILKNTD